MDLANQRKLQFLLITATNLIPLAGVTLWQWNAFQIIFLFWLESAIVGIYTIFELSTLTDSIGLFDLTDPPSAGNVQSFIAIYFPILAIYLYWVAKVISGNSSGQEFESLRPFLPQIGLYSVAFLFSHQMKYQTFKTHAERADLSAIGYFVSPFVRLSFVHLLLITSVYCIYYRHASAFYFVVTYFIKLLIDFGFHWWHEAHIPKVIKDRDFFGA